MLFTLQKGLLFVGNRAVIKSPPQEIATVASLPRNDMGGPVVYFCGDCHGPDGPGNDIFCYQFPCILPYSMLKYS